MLRAKFLGLSVLKAKLLAPLLAAPEGSLLHRHLEERPEVLGVLLWPYQCAAWDAEERVARIAGHFGALEGAPDTFKFSVHDKLLLLNLDEYRSGTRVVLDQPAWLVREGHFALNLFNSNHRSYSLSFSLFEDSIFIGGLQGRNTEGMLDLYRNMTKDFHGLRPRDLLIELLRMLAPLLGVRRIHAVADRYRFFRHPYFAGNLDGAITLDYDEIWRDRGGELISASCFQLPFKAVRRSLEEISSKKRGMYRRRYEMLDDLEEQMQRNYALAPLIRFDAT